MDQAIVSFFNHVLDQNYSDRAILSAFSGKNISLNAKPFSIGLQIEKDGFLVLADCNSESDLKIDFSNDWIVNLSFSQEQFLSGVKIHGDAELARTISEVFKNIRWDYEEDLSKVVGDVAAYQLGMTLRGLARWSRDSILSVRENTRQFINEETDLLVNKIEAEAFFSAVDSLRDKVATLEKRLGKLE